MTEPRYVTVYCAAKAKTDAKHLVAHPEFHGRCFAQKVEGRWQCCCCGKSVAVTW